MKTLKRIFFFLVIAVGILFLIPVPQKNFAELYKGSEDVVQSLENFNAQAEKTIEVNGVSWHYIVRGKKGRQVLLFLHGMGGAYDIWWQQINALENDFNIISLTLPAVNSLEQTFEGINAILAVEQVGKLSIIGSSMGGYIAQNFLKESPERLNKLVLGNTFPPNESFTEKNGGIRKVLPFLPEWLIMRIFRNSLSVKVTPFSENSPLVEAYLLEQYYGAMSKKQFIGRLDVVLDKLELGDRSQLSIQVPKLIIEANNDPLIPLQLREELKELYAEATVYTFDNKGHFEYLNAAEEYTTVLRDFLGNPDLKLVKQTIHNYFEGRKTANLKLLTTAFHPSATLVNATDTTALVNISLADYFSHVEQQGATACETHIISAEINDKQAIVRTLFDYGDKKYEDRLMVVKENDRWLIMNKTFVEKK